MARKTWTSTTKIGSTRKTLSFSKSDFFNELVIRLFIVRYNLSKSVWFLPLPLEYPITRETVKNIYRFIIRDKYGEDDSGQPDADTRSLDSGKQKPVTINMQNAKISLVDSQEETTPTFTNASDLGRNEYLRMKLWCFLKFSL